MSSHQPKLKASWHLQGVGTPFYPARPRSHPRGRQSLRVSVRAHPLKGVEPELFAPEDLLEARGAGVGAAGSSGARSGATSPRDAPEPHAAAAAAATGGGGGGGGSVGGSSWFSHWFGGNLRESAHSGAALAQPPNVRPVPVRRARGAPRARLGPQLPARDLQRVVSCARPAVLCMALPCCCFVRPWATRVGGASWQAQQRSCPNKSVAGERLPLHLCASAVHACRAGASGSAGAAVQTLRVPVCATPCMRAGRARAGAHARARRRCACRSARRSRRRCRWRSRGCWRRAAYWARALNLTLTLTLIRAGAQTLRVPVSATEQEEVQVEVTRLLVEGYFGLVRASLQDAVPKAVMHFLVMRVQRGLQQHLIRTLYRCARPAAPGAWKSRAACIRKRCTSGSGAGCSRQLVARMQRGQQQHCICTMLCSGHSSGP